MQSANARFGLRMSTFQDLHAWSVGERRTDFWDFLWDDVELIHEGTYARAVDTAARMDSVPRWFEGVRLNHAENMLFTKEGGKITTKNKEDARVAVTEVREGNVDVRDFTWRELRRRVGLLSNAMRARGVKRGDRVALVASNSMDTLCVFLATTALGALFSSSSTDMGTKGIMDRIVQIKPVWVFVDDYAVYNGKTLDLRPKITEIVDGLSEIKEFRGIVTLPRFAQPADLSWVPRAMTLKQFVGAARGNSKLKFERVEFRDPFLIVYSSGTTGVPKCIVHSVGGTMMSAMKEGKIHRNIDSTTVGLQYTTVSDAQALTLLTPEDRLDHVLVSRLRLAVRRSVGPL
jgi:acetoacetyl-CoA synthetase